MENLNVENTQQLDNNITLKDADIKNLREAAKWATFLAIVGYVSSGIMLLVGLGTLFVSIFISVIYITVGVIYFFVSSYINKFAKFAKSFIASGEENDMSGTFLYLNKFFSTVGILTLIALVLYVLMLLGFLVGLMTIPILNNGF